jgi:hypothetical protein
MRRLLWYGNSSGSDRNPNSSDNPVCLSVQSYGTYCQQVKTLESKIELVNLKLEGVVADSERWKRKYSGMLDRSYGLVNTRQLDAEEPQL